MSLLRSDEEVIVIDDDDDDYDNDVNVCNDPKPKPRDATHDNPEDATTTTTTALLVLDIQQILPHCTREEIQEQLEIHRGNVELAVDALLRAPPARQRLAAATDDSSSGVRHRKKRAHRGDDDDDESEMQLKLPAKRALFVAEKPKESKPVELLKAKEASLSPEWHACYQYALSKEQGGFFVDPDFGPVSSSLDGRRRRRGPNRNDNDSENDDSLAIITCHCGLPAAARQVQSDGPNYGRFYLSCGLVLRQKRRAAVAVIKSNSPAAKAASPSESPRKEPCRFFQWDPYGQGGGSQNGGYASGSRFGYMGWHAFGVSASTTTHRNKDTTNTTSATTTPQFCLYKRAILPDQVQQGAIGNCWFLSALAVVAEKPYLVHRILPHQRLNTVGCYQVNLCLD